MNKIEREALAAQAAEVEKQIDLASSEVDFYKSRVEEMKRLHVKHKATLEELKEKFAVLKQYMEEDHEVEVV